MNLLSKTLKKIRGVLRHLLIGHLSYEHEDLSREIEDLKLILGRHESRSVANEKIFLKDSEFKIFSQFGEDGIIQYLISKIKIENKTFIEFGVGDYTESNTRFLLMKDNWEGLIIDGEVEHLNYLSGNRGRDLMYRNNLRAISKFLTINNINSIIQDEGFSGDIGILSVDVDGVDYWLLEALTVVSPRILIVEYNSTFGDELAVTVPYKKDFDRTNEHYSNLYFGTSLKAAFMLAKKRGFIFVGSNSAGNNAFFVKREFAGKLKSLSVKEGYVKNTYRESLDENGGMTYISSHKERLNLIKNKSLYDLEKKKEFKIKDLYKLS